ncbi:hypothetical protein [Pseudomonas rustica]|uniref:hypothetical protein n=1 Tax=Pseudomonas rustica TaxID=2827099 RepID=UPI001BAF4021|nr:hypothetical protein [Pseudomonas rustica]MBS4090521.1 hypothetical protein [Pseudomonas rustica]
MNKRFIILLDSVEDAQNKALIEWVKESKLGWWHWFQNSWLLASHDESWNARTIRDKLGELVPNVNCLVFELKDGEGTWSGFGPNKEPKDMFGWLRKNWE